VTERADHQDGPTGPEAVGTEAVITFNDVLRAEGVDPDVRRVKMLRHTLKAKERGRQQIHDIWRLDRTAFEEYQRRQQDDFFTRTDYVAGLVVSRLGKTVFVGMYLVVGSDPAPPDDLDPLTGDAHLGRRHLWNLVRMPEFEPYEDRMVIEWGASTVGWHQWAGRGGHAQAKPIVEITTQQEQPFPGWRNFRCVADDLLTIPSGWRGALAANRGVYLLVDLGAGGKQYIGSAQGNENLLGRLLGYAEGGTNGNRGLTRGHRYQVSILEVVGTGASDITIEKIEAEWKDKLGTRVHGLNKN